MQEKSKNRLLAVLIVSTLFFGSSSIFELFQINTLSSEVEQLKISPSTTTTLFTTSTFTETTSVPNVPDQGHINFDEGFFAYKRIGSFDEGKSFTFRNVTFKSLKVNVTTTCYVLFIRVTFPDEVSVVLQVTSCPMAFNPTVQFANHTSPKAGI